MGDIDTVNTIVSGCSNLETIEFNGNINNKIEQELAVSCNKLKTIKFNGTMVEWQSIEKSEHWHAGLPYDCIIQCTDGKLNKNGVVL